MSVRDNQEPHSYLFTVRIWREDVSATDQRLFGRIQLLPNGEVHQFRDLASLVRLIQLHCQSARHATAEDVE